MAPSDYGAVFTGGVDVPLFGLLSRGPVGEINMSYILADQRDRNVVTAFAAISDWAFRNSCLGVPCFKVVARFLPCLHLQQRSAT